MPRLTLIAVVLAGCARSPHPPASPTVCFDVERGIPTGTAISNKLDPQLRILLALRQSERVDVVVEFRGVPADLEAVGFVQDSLVAHPTASYTIATGTLPIDALDAISRIDHVTVVSAPVPLRPVIPSRRAASAR